MNIVHRIITSLPILLFLVAAFLSSFSRRSASKPSKELRNRTARANRDYEKGPMEDKGIAKPQGIYAQNRNSYGTREPRPSQVKVTGGTKGTVSGLKGRSKYQPVNSQGFAPKKGSSNIREGSVESMTNSRGYVDANELDWSFEADNKPRKIPMGFDR